MKSRVRPFVLLIAAIGLILAACGPTAATEAPEDKTYDSVDPFAQQPSGSGGFEQPAADAEASGLMPLPTAVVFASGQSVDSSPISAGRLIIKNADLRLEVEDTDVAVDRATQLVGDLGGYIISSRVWYQDYYGQSLKYASITIGIPVDEFEHGLSRLRGLSVRVVDESASGEDVTDQYVDLESQLTNLEATRERIKSFLDQAENVDEALRINQQLSEIERQIEQIKGQINYLSDRSAFSSITVSFEPVLPEIVATPTPSPTPHPWDPGVTYQNSKRTVVVAYQGIVDFLIWLAVVLVPLLAPPLLILWGVWRVLTRKPK